MAWPRAGSYLDEMKQIVKEIEYGRSLSAKIDRVRRIDENSQSTLDRLLRERHYVTEVIRALGVRPDAFDYDFKDCLESKLEEALKRSIDGWAGLPNTGQSP